VNSRGKAFASAAGRAELGDLAPTFYAGWVAAMAACDTEGGLLFNQLSAYAARVRARPARWVAAHRPYGTVGKPARQ